ncbi:MAG: protein phosphatase 2C domain-containing protein [Chloroflexi bacterium]|nr:protein phosphatase 2C domain-containing protein [Chloroflexota bacterium]
MRNFLKRLFGGKQGSGSLPPSNAKTAPLSDYQLSEITGEEIKGRLAQFIAGSALDIGLRRDNNEDGLLSISGTLGVNSQSQPFGLFAVADGMGGHRNGEVASETALRALGSYVVSKLYQPLFGSNPEAPQDSLSEIMESAVNEAHLQVKRAAPGGGCTLTAALAIGSQLVIAHLGDSRAYSIHTDGRIQTLTRDHSLVKRLEELGQISSEEAAVHPQKSVLYRALGQGNKVDVEIFTGQMPQRGSLLLCSDGLWGAVEDKDIQRIVNSTSNPHLACQYLVEAANAAGGPDNIAALLVRLAN